MEDPSKTRQMEADELELATEYANTVFFAPNVWDLKVSFGELSGIKQGVEWHTSITLPWAQAKLMTYYLAINIAAHEIQIGHPTHIPDTLLPPEPPPPPASDNDDPSSQALFKFVKQHRQEILESLKKNQNPNL